MQKEQFIHIDKYGDKFYFADRKMKILHRENGPAVDYAGGCKEWHLDGKLHREDGPAVVGAHGYKEWYLNGERHREDGPAFECADGYRAWYLNGEKLTEEQFNARMNPVELTLDEIAEKFGVSVDQLKIRK